MHYVHTLVNTLCASNALLFVRPHLVWPEIILWRWFDRSRSGQDWHIAVIGNADRSSSRGGLLEHGGHLPALADQRAYPAAAFGGEIAELDPSRGHDCHGAGIGGVLGLRDQLDRFAWNANGDLEPARRAALVGIVSADDFEGVLWEGQLADQRAQLVRKNHDCSQECNCRERAGNNEALRRKMGHPFR